METMGYRAAILLIAAALGIATGYVHIESQLDNKKVEKGQNVTFVCRTKTHPLDSKRLVVRWKHRGLFLNLSRTDKYYVSVKDHSLTIINVKAKDSGIYTCIASVGIDMDLSSGHLTVRTVPNPPLDVQIISCLVDTAEILWSPNDDRGSRITKYIVQYNTSSNPSYWHTWDETVSMKQRTLIINLHPYGNYSFRMIAENSVGQSDPSLSTRRTCSTPPGKPDGNPKNVHTDTSSKGKLKVVWSPMPRLLHNGPGFQYIVSWRPKGRTYWNEEVVENPTARMLEVDVADVYGLYQILVKSKNSIGESPQPAFMYVGHSGEAEPMVAPRDFRLDPTHPVQDHSAHFIWEAVDKSTDKIRGKFKGYKLRYWKSSEGRYKMKEIDIIIVDSYEYERGPDVRAAIHDLPAYEALRAQVVVINSHYAGPPSQTIDFITPEGVPGPVRNLRAEAYGTTYVLLKWLPPDQPNGLLIGYDIGYQKVDGLRLGNIMSLKPQISNPSTLGARITGLHTNNSYRFFVWARTKTGRGDNYYVEIRTADGEPPALPRLRVSQVHENHVNLTWSSPRKQDLHYYLQYREIGDSKWVATDSEWERSWKLIENLQPGTMYEVRAVARNRLGDMATSISMVVSTPQRDFDSQYITSNRLLENYNTGTSIASWTFSLASIMCTLTLTSLAVSMITRGTTTVFH